MVYELLYQTSYLDKVMIPVPDDVSAFVSKPPHRPTSRKINLRDSLPFLSCCQQVLDEATTVLYSSHTFYFDDTEQNEASYKFNVTQWCRSCKNFRPGDPHCPSCEIYGSWECAVDNEHEHAGRKCIHYDWIQACNYIHMFDWMQNIGEGNRRKLRHIQLNFTGCEFTRYAEECIEDRELYLDGCGGELLGKAFKLLSEGHNLYRLELSSRTEPYSGGAAFLAACDLFKQSGKMRERLEAIRPIKQLKCTGEVKSPWIHNEISRQNTEKVRVGLQQVREVMESGFKARRHVESSDPFTQAAVDQVARAIVHQIPKTS